MWLPVMSFNDHHMHKPKQQKTFVQESYNLVNFQTWVNVNQFPNNLALFSTS